MAGLGTGMAPFRAFLQERAALAVAGVHVGACSLYFGARYRASEFLYGSELTAFEREGVLTHLRTAFSRDGPEKVYIQHLMQEDAKTLYDLLGRQEGTFYLCGPTWPEADVQEAVENAFMTAGGMSQAEARAEIQKMKHEKRYVLEVY